MLGGRAPEPGWPRPCVEHPAARQNLFCREARCTSLPAAGGRRVGRRLWQPHRQGRLQRLWQAAASRARGRWGWVGLCRVCCCFSASRAPRGHPRAAPSLGAPSRRRAAAMPAPWGTVPDIPHRSGKATSGWDLWLWLRTCVVGQGLIFRCESRGHLTSCRFPFRQVASRPAQQSGLGKKAILSLRVLQQIAQGDSATAQVIHSSWRGAAPSLPGDPAEPPSDGSIPKTTWCEVTGEPSPPVSPSPRPLSAASLEHPVPCDAPNPVPAMGLMSPASLGKEGTTLPKAGAAGLTQPGDGAAAPCLALVDLGSDTPILGKGRGCFPCMLSILPQKKPS